MQDKEIHIWQHCHHCGARPIVGLRYHCLTCPEGPEGDLCSTCYSHSLRSNIHPAMGQTNPSGQPHQFLQSLGKLESNYTSWLEIPVPEENQENPDIPPGFIVRPEFQSQQGSFFGGHAFVTQSGKDLLVLTALHVLDELIKTLKIDCTTNSNTYSGRELPTLVNGMNLYDLLEERWMFHDLGRAGAMLVLPNARTGEDEPNSHKDIAAFKTTSTHRLSPLPLAESTPGIGEKVWLIARTDNHGYKHSAVVVDKTAESFVFRYMDPDIQFRATSGAPIINTHNQVVAINVGAGNYGGHAFGHGNHVDNIRAHLQNALA